MNKSTLERLRDYPTCINNIHASVTRHYHIVKYIKDFLIAHPVTTNNGTLLDVIAYLEDEEKDVEIKGGLR